MGSFARWRNEFAGLLEWSVVDKGLLLPYMLLPLFLQYAAWGGYVLLREDRTQLVDIVFLIGQAGIIAAFIVAAVLLILLGRHLRRHAPDALWFQYVCATFYSLSMVYCGYIIGSLSFAAGVVFMGAPVVGFIILERRVVYVAWGAALTATLVFAYAGAIGLLQVAPALVPPTPGDPANQLFWTTSTLFFAAPHILSIMLIADLTLVRWRERELAFRTLSYTDALTGVHNRRSILGILERELPRRQRMGPPVAVLLIDLDHFKRINDTWGHPVGDLVLVHSADALGKCLRASDALGRYGGEEFLVVLPDTDTTGALVIAERCRAALAALAVNAENGQHVRVTGSFGVASNARDPELHVDALVRQADEALYRAKQAGRNRVELAGT